MESIVKALFFINVLESWNYLGWESELKSWWSCQRRTQPQGCYNRSQSSLVEGVSESTILTAWFKRWGNQASEKSQPHEWIVVAPRLKLRFPHKTIHSNIKYHSTNITWQWKSVASIADMALIFKNLLIQWETEGLNSLSQFVTIFSWRKSIRCFWQTSHEDPV